MSIQSLSESAHTDEAHCSSIVPTLTVCIFPGCKEVERAEGRGQLHMGKSHPKDTNDGVAQGKQPTLLLDP